MKEDFQCLHLKRALEVPPVLHWNKEHAVSSLVYSKQRPSSPFIAGCGGSVTSWDFKTVKMANIADIIIRETPTTNF